MVIGDKVVLDSAYFFFFINCSYISINWTKPRYTLKKPLNFNSDKRAMWFRKFVRPWPSSLGCELGQVIICENGYTIYVLQCHIQMFPKSCSLMNAGNVSSFFLFFVNFWCCCYEDILNIVFENVSESWKLFIKKKNHWKLQNDNYMRVYVRQITNLINICINFPHSISIS